VNTENLTCNEIYKLVEKIFEDTATLFSCDEVSTREGTEAGLYVKETSFPLSIRVEIEPAKGRTGKSIKNIFYRKKPIVIVETTGKEVVKFHYDGELFKEFKHMGTIQKRSIADNADKDSAVPM
jgi:hypothetical protein